MDNLAANFSAADIKWQPYAYDGNRQTDRQTDWGNFNTHLWRGGIIGLPSMQAYNA